MHQLNDTAGYMQSHAVVDASSGEDDLRIVAYFLRLMSEVVRIYTNAMPTYEAGFERKEIPFGLGRQQVHHRYQ